MCSRIVRVTDVDPLCPGDLSHFFPHLIADIREMTAVPISAVSAAYDGLRNILADIQSILIPDILPDIGRDTIAHRSVVKQLHQVKDPLTSGAFRFSEIHPLRHFGIIPDLIADAPGCDPHQRIDDMLHSDDFPDHHLAVHAVHRTHHDGMVIHDLFDHGKAARQTAVFDRDDEEIGAMGLLRCPNVESEGLAVYHDALFLQSLRTLSFRDDPEVIPQLFSQSVDKIAADGTGAKNCDGLNTHSDAHLSH